MLQLGRMNEYHTCRHTSQVGAIISRDTYGRLKGVMAMHPPAIYSDGGRRDEPPDGRSVTVDSGSVDEEDEDGDSDHGWIEDTDEECTVVRQGGSKPCTHEKVDGVSIRSYAWIPGAISGNGIGDGIWNAKVKTENYEQAAPFAHSQSWDASSYPGKPNAVGSMKIKKERVDYGYDYDSNQHAFPSSADISNNQTSALVKSEPIPDVHHVGQVQNEAQVLPKPDPEIKREPEELREKDSGSTLTSAQSNNYTTIDDYVESLLNSGKQQSIVLRGPKLLMADVCKKINERILAKHLQSKSQNSGPRTVASMRVLPNQPAPPCGGVNSNSGYTVTKSQPVRFVGKCAGNVQKTVPKCTTSQITQDTHKQTVLDNVDQSAIQSALLKPVSTTKGDIQLVKSAIDKTFPHHSYLNRDGTPPDSNLRRSKRERKPTRPYSPPLPIKKRSPWMIPYTSDSEDKKARKSEMTYSYGGSSSTVTVILARAEHDINHMPNTANTAGHTSHTLTNKAILETSNKGIVLSSVSGEMSTSQLVRNASDGHIVAAARGSAEQHAVGNVIKKTIDDEAATMPLENSVDFEALERSQRVRHLQQQIQKQERELEMIKKKRLEEIERRKTNPNLLDLY